MNILNDPQIVTGYIQRIYQAVMNPDNIYGVVDDLRSIIDAPYGAFQVENIFTHELGESFLIDYDDGAIETYADYYIERDPWTTEALKQGSLNKAFQASHKVLTDKVYRESEFYQDWGKDNGVRHAIGTSFEIENGHMIKISFQRHSDQSEFSQEVEDFLNLLHPHFQRFVQLSSVYNEYQRKQLDITQSLEHLCRPVWIVNHNLEVIYHNQYAESWMRQGQLLSAVGGRLQTPDFGQLKYLKDQVYKMTAQYQPSRSNSNLAAQRIALGVQGDEEVFWLSPFSLGDDRPSLVLITGRKPIPNAALIQKYHGLTKRQSQVSVSLMQGRTLQQIAQDLNISINTVRNTLAASFKKLKVNNQSEFVALLFGVGRFDSVVADSCIGHQ